MRLKSFEAASLPEAMKAVRAHFGPNAIILSTLDDGPGGRVRVTAAIEEEALEAAAEVTRQSDLKELDGLASALSFHRMPQGLSEQTLAAAAAALPSGDPVLALASALEAGFGFQPFDAQTEEGPLLLLGPPGGGKTSSAAKLCTLAKLAGRKTTLITMDGEKAGGRHQIAAFAKALEAKVYEAKDAAVLGRSLEALEKDQLVVIDTPGANAFDPAELDRLQAALAASGAAPVLVLPAGGDALESAEIAQAFAGLAAGGTPLRLIATKLDAARRLGGLLSASHVTAGLLSAAGIAPQVAGGLVPLDPVTLARMMLPEGSAPAEDPGLLEPLRACR